MKKKLSEYLDGELEAEEKAYVEEHLASCEDCSATLAELKKTLQHMSVLDEVEPPPWFAEKVMQRVKEEAEKESFFRKLFYPLHIKLPVEAVALVFVAVFAYYAFDVMKPGVVMKEAVPAEEEVRVPSAGWTDEKAFHPAEEDEGKPFAPTPQVREPEDESLWEKEEIGGRTAVPEPTLERKAQRLKESEDGTGTLMKSEAAPDESRAKKRDMFFRDAEAPAEVARKAPKPEGEAVMDRLSMEESRYAGMAATLPEPSLVLSVAVEDMDFAREEVEGIIAEMGGALIDKDRQPENVVMAELSSDKVDGFLDALESVGEIKRKALMEEDSREQIFVRIELLEEPTPSP
jgi:hypothetical protein